MHKLAINSTQLWSIGKEETPLNYEYTESNQIANINNENYARFMCQL
jgi:hypothetical protein